MIKSPFSLFYKKARQTRNDKSAVWVRWAFLGSLVLTVLHTTKYGMCSGGASVKILGAKRGKEKIHAKRAKICNIYAEIVKFGLILTHLKLVGGMGKQENIWGKMTPCTTCGTTSEDVNYSFCISGIISLESDHANQGTGMRHRPIGLVFKTFRLRHQLFKV